MPWNKKTIKKHNKRGTAKTARMANKIRASVLKRGGSEEEADRIGLATASKFLKSHGKHNAPGAGRMSVSPRGFGFAGGARTHVGSHNPRPGEHGPRGSSGMHRFGALKPKGIMGRV